MKAEPRPRKEGERKKTSVFHAAAAECAEAQRQESSPMFKELRKVQCSWLTAWEDLKRAKDGAGNRLVTDSLHASLRNLNFMRGQWEAKEMI